MTIHIMDSPICLEYNIFDSLVIQLRLIESQTSFLILEKTSIPLAYVGW